MSNPATKQAIKDEIATALMHTNTGIFSKTIVQQIKSSSSVKLITTCLDELETIGDIILKNGRYEISAKGRAAYSEDILEQQEQTIEEPVQESKTPAKPNNLLDSIEHFQAYKTPDGKTHDSYEAAKLHVVKQNLKPDIDKLFERTKSGNRLRNIITHFIAHYEIMKSESV